MLPQSRDRRRGLRPGDPSRDRHRVAVHQCDVIDARAVTHAQVAPPCEPEVAVDSRPPSRLGARRELARRRRRRDSSSTSTISSESARQLVATSRRRQSTVRSPPLWFTTTTRTRVTKRSSSRTRRSRGSRKSGSSGRPAARSARVVEHRVGRAGRRPRRIELGGGDRARPCRVVRRRRRGRSRTNSYQRDRALVGDVEQARRRPSPTRRRACAGEVGGEGGAAALVVDERQLRRARPRGAGRSSPCCRRGRRTPTTCARSASAGHRPRARRPASSGRTPTAGSGASHSSYGSALGAVEHVVGRHVHEVRADPARGRRRRSGCRSR